MFGHECELWPTLMSNQKSNVAAAKLFGMFWVFGRWVLRSSGKQCGAALRKLEAHKLGAGLVIFRYLQMLRNLELVEEELWQLHPGGMWDDTGDGH